jgi:DNA ligase (NAD+)
MSRPADQKRILELRRTLEHHNRLYYVEARPEISDREYDLLYRELQDLETHHPDLVTPDSPTQRVGGEPIKEFQRVRHRAPMLSLEKKEDLRELELFEKEIRKTVPDFQPDYVVEPKIDGVSISLHYVDGLFTQGVTRGDGEYGDDITVNLRTLKDIPLRLTGEEPPPRHLEVRGEAYMREADRIALNETLRARGDKTFANTRNATAGSLKQLDPRIVAERPIRAVLYALGHTEGITFASHRDELEALKAYGLTVPSAIRYAHSMAEAETQARTIKENEDQLPYEIDGCVIKVNDNDTCQRLGLKTNVPAYAVAYKRPEWFNEATTQLLRIVVQVGRTGVLTPVAEVEAGLSRWHHHFPPHPAQRGGDQAQGRPHRRHRGHQTRGPRHPRRGARGGRPADRPRAALRHAGAMPVLRPAGFSAKAIGWRPHRSGPALRKRNLPGPAGSQYRIFCQPDRAQYRWMGEVVADKLVERGLARRRLDLFRLQLEPLANLNLGTDDEPRQLGEKNAQRMLAALGQARTCAVGQMAVRARSAQRGRNQRLQAGGLPSRSPRTGRRHRLLPLIGEQLELDASLKTLNPKSRANKSKSDAEKALLLSQFEQAQARLQTIKTEITANGLDGVGPVVARDVMDFFASPRGRNLVNELHNLHIHPAEKRPPPQPIHPGAASPSW